MKLKKISISLLVVLIVAGGFGIRKISSNIENLEQKTMDSNVKKHEKNISDENKVSYEKHIADLEAKMLDGKSEAMSYVEKRSNEILSIVQKSGLQPSMVPDKTAYYDKDITILETIKGYEYEKKDSIEWTIDVDEYGIDRDTYPLNEADLRNLEKFKINPQRYGSMSEIVKVRVAYPEYTTEVNSNDKYIKFIYEYMKIEGFDGDFNEYITALNSKIKSSESGQVFKGFNVFIEIENSDYGSNDVFVILSDSNFKHIKNASKFEEIVFQNFKTESEYMNALAKIEKDFEEWKSKSSDRSNLTIAVNYDSISSLAKFENSNIYIDYDEEEKSAYNYYELPISISSDVDVVIDSEGNYIKNQEIFTNTYLKEASKIYDFINECLYDNKLKLTKDEFSKSAASVALINMLLNKDDVEVIPGVSSTINRFEYGPDKRISSCFIQLGVPLGITKGV